MSAQLSFDLTPRAAGERAADLCASRAQSLGWDREGCARFVLGWVRRHGAMSGEALTDAAKAHGYRPHDDRAFGAVFQGLARKNEIRCVGYGVRTKGHGTSGLRIWGAV